MKKIVFLHGFTSGGNSETPHILSEALRGEAEVVAPDLPLRPTEALTLVRHLCATERPDLVVGISCGGFYAQQMVHSEGVPALLINPFFVMSEFLAARIGTLTYNCPRADGKQTLEVTPALVDEFLQLEQTQFAAYTAVDKERVWGLFGTQDQLAHFKDLFCQYYPTTRSFDGGHAIESENVRSALVPMIKEMLEAVSGQRGERE